MYNNMIQATATTSTPITNTKPRKYVLVYGGIYAPRDDNWDEREDIAVLIVYPQNEARRVKGGVSHAINIRLDDEDHYTLQTFSKKLRFTDDEKYPFYRENNRSITIVEYLYGYDPNKYLYIFKNGNEYDLKRDNVIVCPHQHSELIKKYNVIDYIPGHVKTIGQQANKMKNPMWKIKEEDKDYILMYCEKDTLCKLCPTSYQKILDFEQEHNNENKMTFFKHSNGYINSTCGLFIHQIITGCHGNGKGTKNISVDHIDQDPLNNTYDNLRIATRKEQEQNSKGIKEGTKRARKADAPDYPEGITHDMIPKYINYRGLDKYGTSGKTRSYFVVEKHPTLIANNKKALYSSKSEKVSPEEKLQQAIDILSYLDKGEMPPSDEPVLPKYYSLITARGKPNLVYERRTEDGVRQNVKMVLPEEYDLAEQLERIQEKVVAKYGE
jgi:hypothetical protein